jgi:hypothetical protein
MSMLVIWVASSSLLSATNPPMFTSPSFLAETVQPSASAKNSRTMSGISPSAPPRTLLK